MEAEKIYIHEFLDFYSKLYLLQKDSYFYLSIHYNKTTITAESDIDIWTIDENDFE